MRYLLMGLMMAAPLAALGAPLSTMEQTKAACGEAAGLFAAGDPERGYEVLAEHWPLPPEELKALGYQTRMQLDMVASRFGAPVGAEFVRTDAQGDSLHRHVFLVKHSNHAMRFTCVFYRPKQAWIVNAIFWDDKPHALFSE